MPLLRGDFYRLVNVAVYENACSLSPPLVSPSTSSPPIPLLSSAWPVDGMACGDSCLPLSLRAELDAHSGFSVSGFVVRHRLAVPGLIRVSGFLLPRVLLPASLPLSSPRVSFRVCMCTCMVPWGSSTAQGMHSKWLFDRVDQLLSSVLVPPRCQGLPFPSLSKDPHPPPVSSCRSVSRQGSRCRFFWSLSFTLFTQHAGRRRMRARSLTRMHADSGKGA